MYSDIQKALLPLVTCITCSILFLLLYRFGKRPVRGTKSLDDRLELLYSYTAAAVFGNFLFQSFPNAIGPSGSQVGVIAGAFTFVGFFIMLWIQKRQRVSHDNPYYVSPELNAIEIRSIVNNETMEMVDYYQACELDSESVAKDRLQLQDEMAELKKRRRICLLTVVILSVICIFEGFFLIYREPTALGGTWSIFVFFVIHKMMESLIIGTSLLHSYTHTHIKTYLLYSMWWVFICIISTVPALTSMPWTDSFTMVNHLATSIFYALAGGVLFWIAMYYIWIDRRKVDQCDTTVRLIVFGVTGGVCWLVGFFI